jgi:hypothetical protein
VAVLIQLLFEVLLLGYVGGGRHDGMGSEEKIAGNRSSI